MTSPTAIETIRAHGEQFLGIVADRSQPREVRVFATHVVSWAITYVRDERMLSEVLRVLGRAVDDDDEVELLLLHSLKTTIEFNPAVGAAVLRLGERAFELGRMTALASITAALCFGDYVDVPAPLAPARWVARLVGTAAPETATLTVLTAVAAWLGDGRNDVGAVKDVLVDPQTWLDAAIASF